MENVYLPPDEQIEPGDIFRGIPFPSFKYPLTYFRPSVKTKGTAAFFSPEVTPPKAGDSPRCTLDIKTVMFLSHGCEVAAVERDAAERKKVFEKRYWLAAPIRPLEECGSPMQQKTRERRQPNKFYLPPTGYLGNGEFYVDLRKITPINCRYFAPEERLCSLSDEARRDLHSLLGVFFSGLALYMQPISCPSCGLDIDPTQFLIKSEDEEDID